MEVEEIAKAAKIEQKNQRIIQKTTAKRKLQPLLLVFTIAELQTVATYLSYFSV